jgi:hypothetical protein
LLKKFLCGEPGIFLAWKQFRKCKIVRSWAYLR